MNPRLQKLGSDWKTYVALLSAASAGVSAFTGLGKTIFGAVAALKDLPPGTRWIVAGAFVAVIGPRRKRVLRALLAVDEKEQSITIAGDVPEGSYARFTMGQVEDLIVGTLKAAQASLDNLHAPQPNFSLLVSCNARRAVLKQRVEEEVEAVRDVLGDQNGSDGILFLR
jgi:hypothetical protein